MNPAIDVTRWSALQWEVYALNFCDNEEPTGALHHYYSRGIDFCVNGRASLIIDNVRKIATLIFRGTNNLENRVNDVIVMGESLRSITAQPLQGQLEGIQVHAGFACEYRALQTVFNNRHMYDELQTVLTRDGWYILLTGHSLGGALATLSAADLLLNRPAFNANRIALITFGSPRTGDFAFARLINQAGLYKDIRVEIEHDPVVSLPAQNGGAFWHRGCLSHIRLDSGNYRRMRQLENPGEVNGWVQNMGNWLSAPLRDPDIVITLGLSNLVTSIAGIAIDAVVSLVECAKTGGVHVPYYCHMKYGNCQEYQEQKPLNIGGINQLIEAVKARDVIKINSLIGQVDIDGLDINGWSSLICAAAHGYSDVAERLLDCGADVNKTLMDGKTAFMYAAEAGYAELIRLLHDRGANLNLQDNRGCNALMLAAKQGCINSVETLLQLGADLTQRNHKGRTAVMYAAEAGHAELIRLLHAGGAYLNLLDNRGNNALMIACGQGRRSSVEILLQLRADPMQRNRGNHTVFTICNEHHRQEILELLGLHGILRTVRRLSTLEQLPTYPQAMGMIVNEEDREVFNELYGDIYHICQRMGCACTDRQFGERVYTGEIQIPNRDAVIKKALQLSILKCLTEYLRFRNHIAAFQEEFKNLFAQLPDNLKNQIYGFIYALLPDRGINRMHQQCGELAFNQVDNFNTTDEIRIRAMEQGLRKYEEEA